MGVEIERKFTVRKLPQGLEDFPVLEIEQAYLNVRPAIRIRRQDDKYIMTYKGGSFAPGGIGQTEYNMPLDKAAYEHLLAKADGNVIAKKRYIIPINTDAFGDDFVRSHPEITQMMERGDIKIELDVFTGKFEGRILAEVEFPSEEAAAAYHPADFFLEDVTGDPVWSNAHMSTEKI